MKTYLTFLNMNINNTLFKVGDDDYVLEDLTIISKPKFTYEKLRIAYWQSERLEMKYSCSLHAVMTALSNQFDLFYTLADRLQITKLAVKKGFDPKFGWDMHSATAHVVDWTNKNMSTNIEPIRISWRLFRKATYLGFNVVTGLQIKEGYNQDKFDNGVIDFSSGQYGDTKYGHLINLVAIPRFFVSKQLTVVDNYKDKSRLNEYAIKHSALRELAADGVLFPSGYIFTEQATEAEEAAIEQGMKDKENGDYITVKGGDTESLDKLFN